MKLRVAQFFAGLFGALATLLILLSLGDYWLLASETCKPHSDGPSTLERGDVLVNHGSLQESDGHNITFYHEGFMWRCTFDDKMEEDNLWEFWFEQEGMHVKVCTPAYLLPFPIPDETYNTTSYTSAIIYRGFWSVSMLIGVATVIVGGFIIICAAPFASHRLYKAGGALYLISGFFLLVVSVMYVIWLEILDVMSLYVDYQRSNRCSDFELNWSYGLSFMFAPVAVFFCLLTGLLFLVIGRTVQQNYH